jgi:hypothetical protein
VGQQVVVEVMVETELMQQMAPTQPQQNMEEQQNKSI